MTAVTGRCVDASGASVPGAYVYAYPTSGGRFGGAVSTHSRADGWWWLDLPPGQWVVRETGHAAHNLLVANDPIDATPEGMAQSSTEPSHTDVNQLLARRRGRRAEQAAEAVEPGAEQLESLLTRRRQRRAGQGG